MSDKIKRIIPVTPDHSVILYEAADPREGSYISIRHNEKVNNMPGEVLIAPGDTPALVKALTFDVPNPTNIKAIGYYSILSDMFQANRPLLLLNLSQLGIA